MNPIKFFCKNTIKQPASPSVHKKEYLEVSRTSNLLRLIIKLNCGDLMQVNLQKNPDFLNHRGKNKLFYLALVVLKLDSAIHWINHYPADSLIAFPTSYPLDSDLSGG